MRLFVGISLPDNIREEAYNIQKSIDSKNVKINFIAKKNFHLTLKFLGEIVPEEIDKISERLNQIDQEKFKVNLSKVSFFKHNGDVSVIYLTLEPGDRLIRLQQKVDEILLDLFYKDQRFSPHLTLGRIKLIKKRVDFIKNIKEIKVNNLEFEIKEFHLIESKLTKDGPNYKILKTFNK